MHYSMSPVIHNLFEEHDFSSVAFTQFQGFHLCSSGKKCVVEGPLRENM